MLFNQLANPPQAYQEHIEGMGKIITPQDLGSRKTIYDEGQDWGKEMQFSEQILKNFQDRLRGQVDDFSIQSSSNSSIGSSLVSGSFFRIFGDETPILNQNHSRSGQKTASHTNVDHKENSSGSQSKTPVFNELDEMNEMNEMNEIDEMNGMNEIDEMDETPQFKLAAPKKKNKQTPQRIAQKRINDYMTQNARNGIKSLKSSVPKNSLARIKEKYARNKSKEAFIIILGYVPWDEGVRESFCSFYEEGIKQRLEKKSLNLPENLELKNQIEMRFSTVRQSIQLFMSGEIQESIQMIFKDEKKEQPHQKTASSIEKTRNLFEDEFQCSITQWTPTRCH